MPPPELMDRHQHAVLWKVVSVDRYNEPTLGKPCQVLVKWNWNKATAETPEKDATNYIAQVVLDRDPGKGSVMWLGKLLDYKPTAVNEDNPLCKVDGRQESEDLKGRDTAYRASLSRYSATPPPGAD